MAWLAAPEPLATFTATITQAEILYGIESLSPGKRGRGRPISQFDAMIAAIARSRRAAVATRNVADFDGCGVRIVNPWTGRVVTNRS